jgi:hypothetical protein
MKLKALAAAAALVLTGTAQAASPGFLGPLENVSVPIGAFHDPGLFTDLYGFTISSIGIGVGATVSISIDLPGTAPGPEFDVSFLGIGFLSGSTVLAADIDGSDGWSVAALLPGAGTYSFAVIGVADGTAGGAYGGVLQTLVPSPVPEPQSYALLLAGLGVLGFVASRRKQS